MSQDSSTTSELTIDVTCTPRNRANLRRLKTSSVQSYQRWEKENELLYAMIEDESAWLTRLFPDAFLTPELFFYALEDGTILCRLANFIQEMADKYGVRTGKSVPGKKFTFHKSKRGSRESKLFHSRENVDKFLTWCRWHGVPEAVLFESNDAVLVDECRTGGREIVICLMEIARRSSKYEIQEVPQLIKLEREIEEEELNVPSCADEQQGLALDTSTVNIGTRGDRSSPIDSDSGVESVFEEGDPASPRLMEFFADETTPEPTKVVPKGKNMNKSERDKKPQRAIQKDERSLLESSQPKTELDEKVCKIAQEYNIKIVHRLKEGKYIILGKTMFVRMLNDHLLVRIGGGWDTLDHYVMTHAPKSTEGTSSTSPSSADRKSSGVWSKLVEKVKRRESQPNITESPVVISKQERPDSSPSVYRLRDRVRKKLSVTEKDEKDISDAIRKIESSVTQTVISSHSPSFTSKTFFQLKNRFDKGRKRQLSRENIFHKKESNKMADQNVETFTTDEKQREAETKQEGRSATTVLLESQKPSEPNEITESTQRVLEEFSTSTTTVTEPLSSDFQFESGKEDFHAEIDDDSQQSLEHFTPGDDDFLSFDQQTQESTVETEKQNFSTMKSDDIFFNDNPPLFHSEAQQPEPVRNEEQSTVNKDELMLEEESRVEVPPADDQEPSEYLSSDTNFFAEIAQGIEFQPLGISPEAEQTEPNPFVLEPKENEPKSNIEDELEKILQEPPAADQADSFSEVAGDVQLETIKVSYESEEAESAPFVLPPQADRPEGQEHQEQAGEQVQQEQPGEQVQEGNEDRASEISMEYSGGVSNKPEPECDGLPAEVTGGSDVALEIETPLEDVQSSKTAVKDVGYLVSQKEDKEKNEMVVQNMFTIDKGEEPEDNRLPAQITETDLLIPVKVDKDVLPKDEEEFEDRERPAQIEDYAHDSKIEEQTLPEIVNVVESEEKVDEKELLANIVDVEKSSKEESVSTQVTEMAPPALSQNVEEPKAKQNEVKDVPPVKNTAPVSHKKQTKKVPGTSKKEHEKSVSTTTSKNLTGSKKEDHKAERPKGSATRPTASRTAKTTSATTASKAKTVPAAPTACSTSATKRPPSAPTAKSGSGISKPTGPKIPANGVSKAGTKTTPKSSQPQNPPNAGNVRPTSTARDKKAPPSSGTQKAESKSRPRSAVSTKSTDKADEKVESSRPLSTKTKPLSGTTRTTVKKTTTSTTKSTIGPASVSEVSKTTVTTSKGGITSSTSTTTKKSTEPGGRTKSLKETTPHQKASARNKASEMRSGIHGKPGSASTKTKPPSAITRERAGSAMTKEKPGSERPKSPTKRAPKELAAAKHEEPKAPVEEKPATEPAAITVPIVPGASDVITPDGITDTKDDVTRVIQHTEVVEDDGETKIVHTKEVTETVTENGEQQIVTTEETVVEASGYPSKIIT